MMVSENNLVPELLGKFRCLTPTQLQFLTKQFFSRATLYRRLTKLKHAEIVNRVFPLFGPPFVYVLSEKGETLVRGQDCALNTPILRTHDIPHAVEVADIAIELFHYPKVVDIKLEHDFTDNIVRESFFNRRPDGIIDILTASGRIAQVALEVECSLKSHERIKEILAKYENTFKLGRCKGVVIVATQKWIFDAYKTHIRDLPEAVQNQIRLCEPKDILNLRESTFGKRENSVRIGCQNDVTKSHRLKSQNQ